MMHSAEKDAPTCQCVSLMDTSKCPVHGVKRPPLSARDAGPSQGQKRLAYVIHEAVCTAYKHEGRNALCDRAAIAVMASEWLTDAIRDAEIDAERTGFGNGVEWADSPGTRNAARAWDEGHEAGFRYAVSHEELANPYAAGRSS